jgi:predicted alpha/beta hydrolase family esterase/uncharacterized cupin superfamily protein
MSTIFIPGLGGPEASHWQSRWQASMRDAVCIAPASWDEPDLWDWVRALDDAVRASSKAPLLVAHGLGCILVAHWAQSRRYSAVAGAFLVGVPDSSVAALTPAVAEFYPAPPDPLAFPALVLTSMDESCASRKRAQELAAAWGAGFLPVGALGHLNAASGLRDWQEGAMLLSAFAAGLGSQILLKPVEDGLTAATGVQDVPAIIAADVPPRRKPSNYPEPFRSRMRGRLKRQLGDLFGLTNFGVNLTVLAPGAISALHHVHSRQDEFIYVLDGEPTLFTGNQAIKLRPGMVAGFKAGGAAHHIENRTVGECAFIEIGDRTPGDQAAYPDDDLEALLDGSGVWRFRRKDGTPY